MSGLPDWAKPVATAAGLVLAAAITGGLTSTATNRGDEVDALRAYLPAQAQRDAAAEARLAVLEHRFTDLEKRCNAEQ